MAVTNLDVQTELKRLGLYTGDLDGLAGPKTSAAVVEFQKSKGLTETGKVDPKTLAALFPKAETKPKTISGMFQDYLLNFLKSKTTWAAGALVAFLVTWVQTKFGLTVSPEIQAWVTTGIVTGFGALIGILQAAFQNPHMTKQQPAVVQRPAETVGVEKK